jgi:hypothetical protein
MYVFKTDNIQSPSEREKEEVVEVRFCTQSAYTESPIPPLVGDPVA